MASEYHPVEVVLGEDGSWAVEGIPKGKHGAERVMTFLLGSMPEEGSYQTNVVWDWIYFVPGSLTNEVRAKLDGVTGEPQESGVVYKVRHVPHVNKPGAYTESIRSIHEEAESSTGKVIATSLIIVAVLVLAYFGINSRTAGYVNAGIDEVVAAAKTPYETVGFFDKFKGTISDGDHFAIPLTVEGILHRASDGVILKSGSVGYLLLAPGIGTAVADLLQGPDAELLIDTSHGPKIYTLDGAGKLMDTSIHKIGVVGSQPEGEFDHKIRYDETDSFETGTTYNFNGAIEWMGKRLCLYHPPEKSPTYRVEMPDDGPDFQALLSYLADGRYAIHVYGVIDSSYPWTKEDGTPGARQANRVIGTLRSGCIVGIGRGLYQAVG